MPLTTTQRRQFFLDATASVPLLYQTAFHSLSNNNPNYIEAYNVTSKTASIDIVPFNHIAQAYICAVGLLKGRQDYARLQVRNILNLLQL